MEIFVYETQTGKIVDGPVSVSSAEVADLQPGPGQWWIENTLPTAVTPKTHWVEGAGTNPILKIRPWNVAGFEDGPAPLVLSVENEPDGTSVRARAENRDENDPTAWVQAAKGEEPITLANAGRYITEVIAPFPSRVLRQVTVAS